VIVLDTSALTKVLLEEEGSGATRAVIQRGDALGLSRLTPVEAAAVLARARRTARYSVAVIEGARNGLRSFVRDAILMELDAPLLDEAESLAGRHVLSGADAVQLAATLLFQRAYGALTFACYDQQLRAAARAERIEVFPR
jgi:predicted nucleic acid-binding protein